MRTPVLTALLATLPLLPWSGSAQDRGRDPQPQELPWRANPELMRQHYQRELHGAWQLIRAERQGEAFSGADAAGYAIFTEGHMALELHLYSPNHLPDTDGEFFQTGIHRWRVNGEANLETYSLIGTTNFTEDEWFEFELPGERREFRVTLEGASLSLRHTDNWGELHFRKLGNLPFPGGKDTTDFYGRELPPVK